MQFRIVTSKKVRGDGVASNTTPRCLRSRRSRLTTGSIPHLADVPSICHSRMPSEPTSRTWRATSSKGAFDIVTEYMRENVLNCKSTAVINSPNYTYDKSSKVDVPANIQSDENLSSIQCPRGYHLRHPRTLLKEYKSCEDVNNESNTPKIGCPLKTVDLNKCPVIMNFSNTSDSAALVVVKEANCNDKSNGINNTNSTNRKFLNDREQTDEVGKQSSPLLTHKPVKRICPNESENDTVAQSDSNRKSPRLNSVHSLVDSTAKAGLDMSQNRSHSNQSVLSILSPFMCSPTSDSAHRISLEATTTATASTVKNKTRRSAYSRDARAKRKPTRTSSSLIERPRPSSLQYRSTMTSESLLLSNRHPFLHHWEREQSRPIENGWRSRRNAYLTLLLAVHDSSADTESAGNRPSTTIEEGKLRSSEKRPLAPRRDYRPYYSLSEDDKVVSNEVAFQDRAIFEFEPLLLGHRWINNPNSSSTHPSEFQIRNKSFPTIGSDQHCESMLLWN